jgi:ribonuclease-3
LINWAQRSRKSIQFDAREETNSDRQRVYYVSVLIDEVSFGEGLGFSKKAAEQSAAEAACNQLFADSDMA